MDRREAYPGYLDRLSVALNTAWNSLCHVVAYAKGARSIWLTGLFLALFGMAALVPAQIAGAADPARAIATPDELKVLFLYNFAKFVRWPAAAFDSKEDPIRIGVLNDETRHTAVGLVDGLKAQGRSVEFETCLTTEDFQSCHILYLDDPSDLHIKSALAQVSGLPVLTVGEGVAFNRWGGIIAFQEQDHRLRFSVRLDAARSAGLRLSSQLIEIGDRYKETEVHARMQRFRDMPIKWKLIVITLVTSGTALLVASASFLTYDQVSFRRAMRGKVQTLARVIGENSTAAVSFGDTEVATRHLAALEQEPSVQSATLRDLRGSVVGSYLRDGATSMTCPKTEEWRNVAYERGMLCVREPVTLEGETIGTLCIGYSLRAVQLRLVRYTTVVFLVLLLSLAVAWVLANRLQTQVSVPILHLTTTADRVSREKDFTLRAEGESKDELGALVKGFNTMLDQIHVHEVELRHYQSRLRDMADQVLLSEERERRRISTGLHDSICQMLWVASMHLKKLADGTDSEQSREMLDQVLGMIDSSLTEVRSFVFELSPPALSDLGLCPALKTLADEMQRRYELQVEICGDNVEREYGDELNVFLYRAIREALTNTAKYAKSKKATIDVTRKDDGIRIAVSDDGVGFDPETTYTASETHGFGLFSIRERMNSLDGKFEVKSAPGEGTTILMEVPRLAPPEPETI